jgi:hypothetical protein
MNEIRQQWDERVAGLRQERDELRVRMHLAKAEIRDEWEALERKWSHLEGRMRVAGDETREASREVGSAFSVLADEIGSAYRRIRRQLH